MMAKIPVGSTFNNATEVYGERDYFVSAVDGKRFWLMAGPYETHRKALDAVADARRISYNNDPRSFFYDWGTCSLEKNSGKIGSITKAGLMSKDKGKLEPGQRIDHWTLIKMFGNKKWMLRCECGNKQTAFAKQLNKGVPCNKCKKGRHVLHVKEKPMTKAKNNKPLCTIGERSLNHKADEDLIIKHLLEEQRKDKPAWFDGTHFYFTRGKYKVVHLKKKSSIKKMHNLSLEGMLNHFEPCEFYSYNRKAEELYQERKDRLEKKREEHKRQEEQANEERRQQYQKDYGRIEFLDNKIREWARQNKVKGKKAEFELKDGDGKIYETVSGTTYENLFGIHTLKEHKGEYNIRVTHLLSGATASNFPSKKSAREFIFSVLNLFDWNFESVEGMPHENRYAKYLANFFNSEGIWYTQLDQFNHIAHLIQKETELPSNFKKPNVSQTPTNAE